MHLSKIKFLSAVLALSFAFLCFLGTADLAWAEEEEEDSILGQMMDEDEEDAQWRRPVPLLLFDQWDDPFSLHSLHEERPDLVEKYTAFLETQWEAHQALAQRFTPGGDVQLTPQQLETLRSLGYIQ